MVFLSVVIPTFNSEKTIERCLDSLVSQSFRDFEICIIDGNSSDLTLAKVCKYMGFFKRINILIEPDNGVYDAMNKGVDLAKGQWLYFLGSDDRVFDMNVFADIFKSAIPKRYGLVYGDVYISDDTSWSKADRVYDGKFDIEKLLSKNVCHQSIFYRKNLFKKLGKYNLKYPVTADWDLNLRFFSRCPALYIDRVVAKFSGGGISSGDVTEKIASHVERIKSQATILRSLYRLNSFKFF
jgi:glycosyltransferase involved in cell wall biosynthesis